MAAALKWPIIGALVAIAVTTSMDATGLSNFSALPLFPLLGLFWYIQRLPRKSVGLAWGLCRDYGLAVLYPVLVMGAIALIAAAAGVVDISHTDWRKAALNLVLITVSTILVALLTEEGFFRGWLWASLRRAGIKRVQVLISTSIVFALWHLSSVTLDTGFRPAPAEVPVFMVNAAVIGLNWGLMRALSGSVVVTSLSHGIWNGLAYALFGFGTKVGALGVANTALFGPELGILGLVLNLLFAAGLWWWSRGRFSAEA